MLSQLRGTVDVGIPEIVLSDPRQRGADRFRSSVLAIGAQQAHLVRPAVEVRWSSVGLNRLDAIEHLTSERQVRFGPKKPTAPTVLELSPCVLSLASIRPIVASTDWEFPVGVWPR